MVGKEMEDEGLRVFRGFYLVYMYLWVWENVNYRISKTKEIRSGSETAHRERKRREKWI